MKDWIALSKQQLHRIPILQLERDCTQRRLHQSFSTLMFLNFNVVLLASYADMTAQPILKLDIFKKKTFLPKNKRKAGICNYCSTLVVHYHFSFLISLTHNRVCCFSVLLPRFLRIKKYRLVLALKSTTYWHLDRSNGSL